MAFSSITWFSERMFPAIRRFLEFAERVRDTTWEIFANQDVPFEDVIKSRKADGTLCPEPFFHINFNCYRAYGGSSNYVLEPAKIQVVPIPSISQGAFYRLNFFMVERESGWRSVHRLQHRTITAASLRCGCLKDFRSS